MSVGVGVCLGKLLDGVQSWEQAIALLGLGMEGIPDWRQEYIWPGRDCID